MRMLNAVICCVLVLFAVLHFFIPNHLHVAAVFGTGAMLAFITIFRPGRLSANGARFFAVCTTATMFFYFAGFFKMASGFEENWYQTGAALEGIGFLMAAFLMIPILSCYSCLLKAEGCEHFAEEASKSSAKERGAFFGVPKHMQQDT